MSPAEALVLPAGVRRIRAPVVDDRRRLTAAGWSALAIGVLLASSPAWSGGQAGSLLGLALLVSLLAAWLLVYRRLGRITGRWLLPGGVHAGETFTIGAVLWAEAGAPPITLAAWEPGQGRCTPVSELPGLGPAPTRLAWGARFPHRGLVRLPGLQALGEQPFGLVVAARTVTDEAELLVLPTLGRVTGHLGERLERWLEHGPTSDAPGEDEIACLRAYRPGDPMRRIHWRASARMRQLLVAERHAPTSRHVAIVLDAPAAAGGGLRFERMVSVAATLVDHLGRRGWSCSLHGQPFGETGIAAERPRLLQHLALVVPAGQGPVHRHLPHRDRCIVLTLGDGSDLPADPRLLVLPASRTDELVHLPRLLR